MDILVLAAYVLILYLVFLWLRHRWEKPLLENLQRKAVFITGCDTGFGHDLVLKCLDHGMPIIAGCLTEQGAAELRAHSEARGNSTGTLTTLIVNVADDRSVAAAAEVIKEKCLEHGGLHGVVNNAGISGDSGPDDWLTIEDYKKTLEVNTFGMIRVTHALKPLIKKSRGRIVNMASIAGRVPCAGMGPYTVSKFALEAYNDILRQEMRPFGIHVAVIEPGFFETPISNIANWHKIFDRLWKRLPEEVRDEYGEEYKERLPQALERYKVGASSDLTPVIDAYFHALTAARPRSRYVCGLNGHLAIPLTYLPSFFLDFIEQLPGLTGAVPTPNAVKKYRKRH